MIKGTYLPQLPPVDQRVLIYYRNTLPSGMPQVFIARYCTDGQWRNDRNETVYAPVKWAEIPDA